MATAFRPRTLILFMGDLALFIVALLLSLFLRALEAPSVGALQEHLAPFSLLFVLWVAVFFVAGLYENRAVLLARRALSSTLLIAQTCNVVLAALFFFFVPFFGIAPKTLLFIYLAVSFVLILLWRAVVFPVLGMNKPEPIVVVGTGPELADIRAVLAGAHRPPVEIVEQGGAWVSLPQLYEDLFGRVALSRVNEAALVESLSERAHPLYDKLKRAMDIAAALVLGVVFLPVAIVCAVVVKLQDGGPVFYRQVRVGQYNRPIVMRKFRSMTGTDQGAEVLKSKLRVTPFGKIIRALRLDELPQLWNILRGDLSMIGPRPEFPALVDEYARQIPSYNLRHLVKPGLSGWAQLYHHQDPHHGTDVEETRNKLSYDLYYLKHRSLVLDLTIAIKTIRRILMRGNA